MLVFNCLRERDPGVLLPALARSLAANGAHIAQVLSVQLLGQLCCLVGCLWAAGVCSARCSSARHLGSCHVLVRGCWQNQHPDHAVCPAPLPQAIFVPPLSQYGSLASSKPAAAHLPAPNLTAPVKQQAAQQAAQPPAVPDYAWQLAMREVWEAQCLPQGHGQAALPSPPLHNGNGALRRPATPPLLPPLPGGAWLLGWGGVGEVRQRARPAHRTHVPPRALLLLLLPQA